MIKITKYIDSGIVHCVTIEFTDNAKPEFKAYYSEFEINLMLDSEQHEKIKENYGQNICLISIEETPE